MATIPTQIWVCSHARGVTICPSVKALAGNTWAGHGGSPSLPYNPLPILFPYLHTNTPTPLAFIIRSHLVPQTLCGRLRPTKSKTSIYFAQISWSFLYVKLNFGKFYQDNKTFIMCASRLTLQHFKLLRGKLPPTPLTTKFITFMNSPHLKLLSVPLKSVIWISKG